MGTPLTRPSATLSPPRGERAKWLVLLPSARGEGARRADEGFFHALASILAIILLLSTPAFAEKYGPIYVESRTAIGSPQVDSYFEYRFDVSNTSDEPHTVTIDVEASVPYGGGMFSRASRRFALAPRSGGVVTVPHYLTVPFAARTARVSVDGSLQPNRLRLTTAGEASDGGDGLPDVLVGRAVDLKLIHDHYEAPGSDAIATWIRTDTVAPGDWSTSWLQYDRFEGIVLTAADWGELPQPVQAAILRWVSAGGSLLFIGHPEGFAELKEPGAKPPQMTWVRRGFGQISAVATEKSISDHIMPHIRASWRHIGGRLPPAQTASGMPLAPNNGLPAGPLFSVLILFATAGGPLNLFLLARRNRRVWIFWTLPLVAVVASVAVIGATILSEGWVRVQRTESLTLLDEARHEATTIGWSAVYATLAPGGGLRFDAVTEARPMQVGSAQTADWTDGQRMLSGWVASRYASYFAIRKSEPRRERLPVRRAGASLIAINGLGSRIGQLFVGGDDGMIYEARNVAPGAEVILNRTAGIVAPDAKEPGAMFGPVDAWSGYVNRILAEPRTYLRRGTYIAVIERSPFVETSIEKPTRVSSRAVVIGLMPGGGDAR